MLSIKNKYYKAPVDTTAEGLAVKVETYLRANAQSMGPILTLEQIRSGLSVPDRALLTRKMFNQVAMVLGLEIQNIDDIEA